MDSTKANQNSVNNPLLNSKIDEWEIDNLPNRLTMVRIVLIPIILISLYLTETLWSKTNNLTLTLNYIAAFTFVIASVTDFFDGHIARKKNIVTVFGSFLDPIADKFLVIASIIMLLSLNRIHSLIVITLVLREMYIMALRLLAMEKGLVVPVGKLGKWKTTAQMIGIPFLMANDTPFKIPMFEIGQYSLYFAAFFSFLSALEYSLSTIKKFKRLRKEQNKLKKRNSDEKLSR